MGIATPHVGRPDEHRVAVRPAPRLEQGQPFVITPVRGDQDDAGEGVPGGANQFEQEVGQYPVIDEERARERRVLATGSIGHRGRHHDIGAGTGEPHGQLHGDPGVRIERKVGSVLFE